jgi:hypothetical protein
MASRQQTCSRERMNSVRQRCRNCDELARDNKDYLIWGKRNQKVGHRKIRPSYYEGHAKKEPHYYPKPRSRSQEVERYDWCVCTCTRHTAFQTLHNTASNTHNEVLPVLSLLNSPLRPQAAPGSSSGAASPQPHQPCLCTSTGWTWVPSTTILVVSHAAQC